MKGWAQKHRAIAGLLQETTLAATKIGLSASGPPRFCFSAHDRSGALRNEQDPAHRLPAFDIGVSGRGLRQWECAVDHDLEFAAGGFVD